MELWINECKRCGSFSIGGDRCGVCKAIPLPYAKVKIDGDNAVIMYAGGKTIRTRAVPDPTPEYRAPKLFLCTGPADYLYYHGRMFVFRKK